MYRNVYLKENKYALYLRIHEYCVPGRSSLQNASITRKYHIHTLQPDLRYREEEKQNVTCNDHMTLKGNKSKATKSLFPSERHTVKLPLQNRRNKDLNDL